LHHDINIPGYNGFMADEELNNDGDHEIDSVLTELKSALEAEKPIEEPIRDSLRKRPRSGRSGKTALDLIFSLRCSVRETAGLEIPDEGIAPLSVKPVASRLELPLPQEERIILPTLKVAKRNTYSPKRKTHLPRRRKRKDRRQKIVRIIAKSLKPKLKKIVKKAKSKSFVILKSKPARKKIANRLAFKKAKPGKAKKSSGKERLARLLMRASRR